MSDQSKLVQGHGETTSTAELAVGEIEKGISWTSGSALVRTQSIQSRCQGNLLRSDVAVGVCFPNPDAKNTWYLDRKRIPMKEHPWTEGPRDLIVLPSGREFQCNCSGSGQGFWLFIDPETIVDDKRVMSFMQKTTVDGSWSKDRLARIIAYEIRKEGSDGFPRGPMFFEHAAAIFLTQLAFVFDNARPRLERIHPIGDIKLRMVIDYIDSNLSRNLTLSELARLVDLTPSYFCAAFKQATGRPPHQFQIERRVEQAKTLLLDQNLSLATVALTVGFNSQSHLNGYFRRIAGLTPARYRAETRPKASQTDNSERAR
jgi:AraC family transcriptional regulator